MNRFLLLFAGVSLTLQWTHAAARFEPPEGQTLLMAGQSVEDIQAYVDATRTLPAGLMTYTSLRRLEGLDTTEDHGSGTEYAKMLLDRYPNTTLQIGLWLVDDCGKIAQGEMDNEIHRLATWIENCRRPVFLRVGYEFDNPDNHYPPKDYQEAFRHIVTLFRKQGVNNVAFVWHSEASLKSSHVDEWYPGDTYVDWVGISYFDQPQSYMLPVVQFAQDHRKPVMIAESCPAKVQTRYANSWNLWFAPLFKFIQAHAIKALCYISCDWDSTEQFRDLKWGDTRIQSNPALLKKWLEATAPPKYLFSSPDLFHALGFQPGRTIRPRAAE